MAEAKVIQTKDVKSFICDGAYSSRMLLDDTVAGWKSIHINEGTLKGGGNTFPGGIHEAAEIYYVVRGEAELDLDGKKTDISPGSLVAIPPGCSHYIKNKSETEDFVLLTVWEDTKYNDVYEKRLKAWGKSFKTVDED